jgi:hypothetical protein
MDDFNSEKPNFQFGSIRGTFHELDVPFENKPQLHLAISPSKEWLLQEGGPHSGEPVDAKNGRRLVTIEEQLTCSP